MNLGENIYRFRTGKNMSQGDLADALDVSRQSVSKWENNSAVPELEKLMKMSELFGVTLDALVGKEPAPQRDPEPVVIRQSTPPHRIFGTVLLCFGLAAFLILSILGGILIGFLAAAPLIVVGGICLVCQGNLVFKCCWGLFVVCAPVAALFAMNFIGLNSTITILGGLLVWFLFLVVWTIIGIRSGRLSSVSMKAVAISIAVFLAMAALMAMLTRVPAAQEISTEESETLIDLE